MRDVEFWDEVIGIGKLEVEINLVVGYEPVLFVCREVCNHDNRYLFMTYDSYESVYVFRKISINELLDMLENRVTMEQTFRNAEHIYVTYVDGELLKYKMHQADSFDEALLPQKNEYFELHSEYILQYICKLKEEPYTIYVDYEVPTSLESECWEYCKRIAYELNKEKSSSSQEYPLQICNKGRSYAEQAKDSNLHNKSVAA